jgi:hypothetical protein
MSDGTPYEWQPIRTASTDGTEILVLAEYQGLREVHLAIGERGMWWSPDRERILSIDPTHWIPAPPWPDAAGSDG